MSNDSGGTLNSYAESQPTWNDMVNQDVQLDKVNSDMILSNNKGSAAMASSGKQASSRESWASVISRSTKPSQNKNVLEVKLEKDTRGSFIVSETECARFLQKIGLDMTPETNVEGVQICPNGRGVLFITLKDNIDINRFCRYEIIDVTSSGIRASLIKPAGRHEVVATVLFAAYTLILKMML